VFKWIFTAALVVSIGICALADFSVRRALEQRQQDIAEKRAELKPLQAMVTEVENYQRKKDALQRRIDVINQLKQNQKGPAAAIDRLRGVDPAAVESIAVTETNGVVVNPR